MSKRSSSADRLFKSALEQFNAGQLQAALATLAPIGDADFDVWHLRGAIHATLANLPPARDCFRHALALQPRHFQLRYNLARVEKELGQADVAEQLLRELHAENQLDYQVANELGTIAYLRNDFRVAEEFFNKALAVKLGFVSAAINLAGIYTFQGRFDEALTLLDGAENQNATALLLQRATILYKAGRFAEAVAAFSALEQSSGFAALSSEELARFHANYGAALLEVEDYDAAEAHYLAAQQAAPEEWLTLVNLAQFHEKVRHDYVRAEEVFARALALYPDHADLHDRYAVFLQRQGLMQQALPHHQFAVAQRPQDPDFLFNMAATELALGQLAEGWKHYDCRWVRSGIGGKPDLPWPEWQGEDGTGKSIYVYREQGLGDEFMFATCLPDLARRFEHVVYACHPKLVTLFSRSYPEVVVVPNRVPRHELVQERFDYVVALGSLPRWLRSDVEQFPAENRPVLDDVVRTQHWQARLAGLGPALRVGLAWRSGYRSGVRDIHYLDLEQLAPVLDLPGVVFINLQYHLTEMERQLMDTRFPGKIVHAPEVDLFDDLDATACLIKNCDLVISPSTSVYMQAGAQNIPTLLLNAMPQDYYQLGNLTQHRWFPSVTILGKPLSESWDGTVAQVAYIVAQLAHEKLSRGGQ